MICTKLQQDGNKLPVNLDHLPTPIRLGPELVSTCDMQHLLGLPVSASGQPEPQVLEPSPCPSRSASVFGMPNASRND